MSTLTNVVVFEGTSYLPDAKRFRATQITNQADEIDRIKPAGDYSGRTDEIIGDLILDYCGYVTAGTLSSGTAMGTITFSGDKTLRRILHEFAEIDGFTWYLKPQGQLFYDDGSNDTGVDITSDDSGSVIPDQVDAFYQNTGINAVIVRGAYVAGVQIESAKQTDAADALLYGETLIIVTDGTIDTTALANTKASNILTREGSDPLTARFNWRNTTIGLPQKGQSITLKYDSTDVNITEAQYIIDKINYDGKTDIQAIECSSGLVFLLGTETDRLPEENSQLIAQLGGSVENNISDIFTNTGDISTNTSDISTLQSQIREIPPSIGVQGGGSDSSAYVTLSAVGHAARASFIIGDDWDESQDIVIVMACLCTSADASVGGLAYVATHPVDNSENGSWNVENGTATSLDSTVANNLTNWTYTLSSGNWSKGDMVWCQFTLNEGARTVYFYKAAIVKYKKE